MFRSILMVVLLAVLSVSCSDGSTPAGGGAPVDKRTRTSEEKREDGRAIYLAVYTGLGDKHLGVPVKIDEKQAPKEYHEAIRNTFIRVANFLEAKDETFFETLSTELRSGDPYLVEAALERGSKASREALPLAVPGSTTELKTTEKVCGPASVAVCVAVTVAAAFHTAVGAINWIAGANVALAVNVYIWQNAEFWDGDSVPVSEKSRRQTEAYIYELTEALYEG